jgi:hypothetical protein
MATNNTSFEPAEASEVREQANRPQPKFDAVTTTYETELNFNIVPEIPSIKRSATDNIESSSDFSVDESGELYARDWSSVEVWPAKLIQVDADFVMLECLTDYKENEFTLRQFSRVMLEGIIPFVPNTFVIIKVFSRPGKQVFEYEHDKKLEYSHYFEIPDDPENKEINTGTMLK